MVEKNHAIVKPDANVASRGMKTYSESRIELLEQPCEPKSLNVALKITGVEKYPRKTCGYGQLRGHLI